MRGNWVSFEGGIGCEEDSNFHQLMLLRANDDETVGLTYQKVLPPALALCVLMVINSCDSSSSN